MKTLSIEDQTWQKIIILKTGKMHKSIDETLNYLLNNKINNGERTK